MARQTLRSWLLESPFSLAMSSGFFGFFAHCGMLDILVSEGLIPNTIAGSSAGALVGGLWASGMETSAMAEELMRLERSSFWDPSLGPGLLQGEKFRKKLEDLLPVNTFEQCRVHFGVSVFNWRTRRTEVLKKGPLAPALHASCAVPLLFHPVLHQGRIFADGGILDRPGLSALKEGERTLFHHLASHSPWRWVDPSLKIPPRNGMVTLILRNLPRPGPFHLEEGRRALVMAREATKRALDLEISQDRVEIS